MNETTATVNVPLVGYANVVTSKYKLPQLIDKIRELDINSITVRMKYERVTFEQVPIDGLPYGKDRSKLKKVGIESVIRSCLCTRLNYLSSSKGTNTYSTG